MINRTRLYFFVDSAVALARFPVQLLIWLLGAMYLVLCMVSWGVIVWVLGDKHIGILKVLILLTSLMTWVAVFLSLYSAWIWF